MDELIKKIITVKGFDIKKEKADGTPYKNNNEWVWVTDDAGDIYKFWKNKADKTESKAFTGGIKAGKVAPYQKIGVAYKEEEYQYVNKKTGEPGTGRNKGVAFFFDPEDVQASQATQEDLTKGIPF